jgi:Ca2+-binding RTX toxin-like protein
LAGGDNVDRLDGGAGNDTLTGGGGPDVFYLGVAEFGDDVITDFDLTDAIEVDQRLINPLQITIEQDAADTLITYVPTGDTIRLTGVMSTQVFVDGDNIRIGPVTGVNFAGSALSDSLTGNVGNDTLTGGAGNDSLYGRDGRDGISGGDGNDLLLGDFDNDTLMGEAGADILHGGQGSDMVLGGDGGDTLNGGLGNDTIDGGTGADTVDYSDRLVAVNVNLINATGIAGGSINSSGVYAGGTLEDTLISIENLIGSNVGDRLVGASGSTRIEGRGGDDRITAFSGNDTLIGGFGNDLLEGAKGSDQLSGSDGNDTLNGGTGFDTLDGESGQDAASYADRSAGVSVNLSNGVALSGGFVNASGFYQGGFVEDAIISVESIIGSAFADRLVLSAAAGRVDGGGGNDNISGLGGADTLIGGAGNDTLSGGGGNDIFEFGAGFGQDRIADFVEGVGVADVIRLVGLGTAFDSFAEVTAAASQSGADVVINFGSGNTLTIANATVAGLVADDFTFG